MMDFSMADIIPALPEIFLSGVALVLVLVAAYGGETAANARRVTQLAIGGIAIALSWSPGQWVRQRQPLAACMRRTVSAVT